MFLQASELQIWEIKYLALAEQINQGKWLYVDIWDNTAPLSALVYAFLYMLFGKTNEVYWVLSAFLVFIQALQWNYWLIKTKMYQERNQVPIIIYLLLASVWIDSYSLSPILLANSFLIGALGNLLLHINDQDSREKSFEIGLLVGVASMFHLPSVLFLVAFVLIFLLLSATKLKGYVLLLLGAILPFVLLGLIFYFKNAFQTFVQYFVLGYFSTTQFALLDILNFLLLLAFPAFLTILGILALLQSAAFINYQVRCQQALIFALLFGLLAFVFDKSLGIFSSAVIWSIMSFFVAHFFLLFKKRWLRNSVFVVFAFITTFVGNAFFFKVYPKEFFTYLSPPNKITYPNIRNKKIWILGEKWEWYAHNQAISPFFDWQLSKYYLENIDYYEVQIFIYEKITKESPDMIVGNRNVIENIMQKIPALAALYQRKDAYWEKIK